MSSVSVRASTRGNENQAPRQLSAACVACGAAWIRSQPASGRRLQPKTCLGVGVGVATLALTLTLTLALTLTLTLTLTSRGPRAASRRRAASYLG